MTDSLEEAQVFTTLDALWRYWQVQIKDEAKDEPKFSSRLGNHRNTRISFGIRNVPATFQHALHIILSLVQWKMCPVYKDGIFSFCQE